MTLNPAPPPELLRLRARVSAYESQEFAIKLVARLRSADFDVPHVQRWVAKIVDEIVAEGPAE